MMINPISSKKFFLLTSTGDESGMQCACAYHRFLIARVGELSNMEHRIVVQYTPPLNCLVFSHMKGFIIGVLFLNGRYHSTVII